jgi:hypothetical protein
MTDVRPAFVKWMDGLADAVCGPGDWPEFETPADVRAAVRAWSECRPGCAAIELELMADVLACAARELDRVARERLDGADEVVAPTPAGDDPAVF